MSKMWLDDVREPWRHGALGFEWCKTAQEAIELLQTGTVTFASLDHDLSWDHYPGADDIPLEQKSGTGYDVVCWMEAQGIWPIDGVQIHSMNPVGRARMQVVVDRHYNIQREEVPLYARDGKTKINTTSS